MHIELTDDDAKFLHEHLVRHLHAVEDEVIHTDLRDLRRELADDAERLRRLIDRMNPG
jgi:Arc/MetJ-type ribon-helix-helix transcriptional regulator